MDIPQEQHFHFKDGESAGDLEALRDKIERVSYDEFYEHVNEEKNDFASWVENVLQDGELAAKLRAVKNIVETVELINERLYPPAEDADDMQARIEQSIFAPNGEPGGAPEISEPAEEPNDQHGEEITLPSQDEIMANRQPGEPVVSQEPAHEPVTAKAAEPHPDHHTFVVRHFLYGLLSGVLLSVIVLQVIAQLR